MLIDFLRIINNNGILTRVDPFFQTFPENNQIIPKYFKIGKISGHYYTCCYLRIIDNLLHQHENWPANKQKRPV
jgi:hypothetical protein